MTAPPPASIDDTDELNACPASEAKIDVAIRDPDALIAGGVPMGTLYDPEDAAFLHDILANALDVPSYAILAASRTAIQAIADRGITIRRVDCGHDTQCHSCDNRHHPGGTTCGACDLAGQPSVAPNGVPVGVVSDASDADIMGVADIYAEARAAPTIVAAAPDPEAVSTTSAIVTATAALDTNVAALDNLALDLSSHKVITQLEVLIKKKASAEWKPKAKIVPIGRPTPLRECGRLQPLLVTS